MSRVTRKLLGRNRNKGDRDGTTSTTADLDEEMEKVFAMSESDKFDFSRFTADVSEQKRERQYNEREINNSHRKKTYPHIHLPLKGLRSHYSKKSNNFNHADKKIENVADSSKEIGNGDAPEILDKAPGKNVAAFYDDRDGEPKLSEKAASFGGCMDASPDKHVKFTMGISDNDTDQSVSHHQEKEKPTSDFYKDLMDHKAKRKYSHHYKKIKKKPASSEAMKESDYSIAGDDDVEDSGEVALQVVLQLEEPLREVVKDDVTSHRLDSFRDKRRFSTKTAISSLLNKRGTESCVVASVPLKLYKKSFDHSPHEVFVQLDELMGVGEEREWKETARWIKYEEDVEEGADRWGRPHVASLSFHSLLNLRRCIETGVLLLDLEEKELPGVAYRVVEQMVVDQVIKESEKSTVIRALLLKHKHVCEHDRFRFIRRNTASYTSLQGLEEMVANQTIHATNNNFQDDPKSKGKHANSMEQLKLNNCTGDGLKPKEVSIDLKEETYASSSEELDKRIQKEKESIMKRIPAGAEATTVLVGTVDFLQEPAIAFVRLAEGIFLPAVTEIPVPVRFMFILLGPTKADVDYHEIGRSMSTLMSYPDFNKEAYRATDRRDLLRAINEFLDYSIVLPPDNWERHALLSLRELRAKNQAIRKRRNQLREEAAMVKAPLLPSEEKKDDDPYGDPLRRTNKLFGGLINDIKRRAPHYKSDFTDGLNHQCFSVALFMFFAALSAAIAFGGLFARKTDNQIGISETLISTAFSGIFYGLSASQPLLIIGTTGPLLLFDESLYKFCLSAGIEYLPMRLYIGIWLLIIALLVASVEGGVFIKVFTRFTEEIFASLISLIYIYESVTMLITLFSTHPLMKLRKYCALNNDTGLNMTDSGAADEYQNVKLQNQPNTALFCLILSLGTFFLAFYLRHFRNSKFFGRSVRRTIGDFGVPISIIVFGALAATAPDTYTDKLMVPPGLEPSTNRTWVVPALGSKSDFPVWAMFIAAIPAFLVYILVFMETNISELLIGKKERKLKKGNGFHVDIVLVCFANVGCAIIGAPWMCAAAVRSLTHLNAVTVMSTTHAPGEKPRVMEVREQRVSGLICSTLVGLSVLMAPILRLLPMAVLFGVFLYMGIVSICGIQFIERLKLFLMPVKHHPQTAYVRKVPTSKMYMFTFIQLLCLIILWAVKSSAISLLFPFFLLMMIPLRAQLNYFFTPSELRALDSDEPDADDKDDEEPDFYEEAVLPG